MFKGSRERLISHRGNTVGENSEFENHPDYLLTAAKDFNVEVDVWIKGGEFFTGHEKPTNKVSKYFLMNSAFLLHAKNLETFEILMELPSSEVFFQENEKVVLTSSGRRVFHSNVLPITDRFENIIIDLNASMDQEKYGIKNAIMSDYPEKLITKISRSELSFDLLILDIDGVLTDGTKIYGSDGNTKYKNFNDKDFTAIKRFITQGVRVVFLSSDNNVNENLAKIRGVEFYYSKDNSGNIDKSQFLEDIKRLKNSQISAYVGDDYYDLTIMSAVDYAFCPGDAIREVKNISTKVLKSNGGFGVIAELFELVFQDKPLKYAHDYVKSI